MTTQAELLAEARLAYGRDPEGALEIYRGLISRKSGTAWIDAALDLAKHEYGMMEFRQVADLTGAILEEGPERVDPGVRAVAGVLYCDAREAIEEPVDESLLTSSIEDALATGHPKYAASGLLHLARRQVSRGERALVRATTLRAVDLYDAAGSVVPGPSALLELARLEIEDGNVEQARQDLERGLAWLKKFPLGGTGARILEGRMIKFRDEISGTSGAQ